MGSAPAVLENSNYENLQKYLAQLLISSETKKVRKGLKHQKVVPKEQAEQEVRDELTVSRWNSSQTT